LLKIDVQRSELSVFQNGQAKLAEAAMAELPIPKTSAMSLLPRTSGLPPKKVALGLTADRKNLIKLFDSSEYPDIFVPDALRPKASAAGDLRRPPAAQAVGVLGFSDVREHVAAMGTPGFTAICRTGRDAAFRKLALTH
jgi:hypothetical protein